MYEAVTDTVFSKLLGSTKPPKEYKGIFQSCEWFRDHPCDHWEFGIMLLFGLLTPMWFIWKLLGSDLTGIYIFRYCIQYIIALTYKYI